MTGFSSINVINSDPDKNRVFVWLRDRRTSQWQDKGILEFGKSMTLQLEDQHTYELACVEPELCGGHNDPNIISCRRLSNAFIAGDKDGGVANIPIN